MNSGFTKFSCPCSTNPVRVQQAVHSESDGGFPASAGLYAWWATSGSLRGVPRRPHPMNQKLDLVWEPLPERRASRIAYYHPGTVDEREKWPEFVDWIVVSLQRLRDAIHPFVDELQVRTTSQFSLRHERGSLRRRYLLMASHIPPARTIIDPRAHQ